MAAIARGDYVDDKRVQMSSQRTAEGGRPRGAQGRRILEVCGSKGGAGSLQQRDGLQGPGEA